MYELTGCDANPKLLQCTSSDCAGSFNGPGLGPTTTGTVTQCVGSNVGVSISNDLGDFASRKELKADRVGFSTCADPYHFLLNSQ